MPGRWRARWEREWGDEGLTAISSLGALPGIPAQCWVVPEGLYVHYEAFTCIPELQFRHSGVVICLAHRYIPRTQGRHAKNACLGKRPDDPAESSLSILGSSRIQSIFSLLGDPRNQLASQESSYLGILWKLEGRLSELGKCGNVFMSTFHSIPSP